MIEFEKVTTRGGDRGESSLYNGERRRKDDLLFHALGDLDELTSHLGVVKALCGDGVVSGFLSWVQEKLIILGAQIATPPRDPLYSKISALTKIDIETLEQEEKKLLKKTVIGDKFILPGDTVLSSHTDVARTVCRRAERWLVTCIRDAGLGHLPPGQNFLNRLSDYLFILARSFEQKGFK